MGLAGIGGMLVGLETVDRAAGGISRDALGVCRGGGRRARQHPGRGHRRAAIGLAEELSLLALPATYKSVVGFAAILLVLTLRPSGLLGAKAA